MTATAWYWLGSPGGNGNGPTELETDAFLFDEDSFVEPTPIEDVNPSDAWDHSDVDEFVFTNQEASDVTALESVVDAAEHFERWYALEGGSTPTAGRGLHVPKDDNGIAIATYRIPPPVHFKPPREGGIGGTIVGGVGVDGGGGIIINGIFHPIGPWNPFLAALAVLGASDGLPAQARVRVQLEALRAIGREAQQLQAELRSASERS
jgi:hypothetical protein